MANIMRVGGGGGSSKKGRPLSALAEGALVSVRENGILQPFYVAKKDYEASLNGAGRVLLVRKDAHSNRPWNTSNVNAYSGSTIDTWLNNDYIDMLSADVRAQMGVTSFRYTAGNGSTTVSTLQRNIFLLSFTEFGGSWSSASVEGETLPIASILRMAMHNGTAVQQWARTPVNTNKTNAMAYNASGTDIHTAVNGSSVYARPCFTLPATMEIADEPNADGSYPLLCDADMSIDSIGDLPPGALVNIEENGVPVPFYVAKQNYESGLNGAGRTLLVRKECDQARAWSSTNINTYATSAINTWLNGEFANRLPESMRALVGVTTFRSASGNGNYTAGELARAVFMVSATELGVVDAYAPVEGTALPVANLLKTAYRNGTACAQWTRSPSTHGAGYACAFTSSGVFSVNGVNAAIETRPCFTIPYNTKIKTVPNADGSYDLDI